MSTAQLCGRDDQPGRLEPVSCYRWAQRLPRAADALAGDCGFPAIDADSLLLGKYGGYAG
jgi:hypothetical protein